MSVRTNRAWMVVSVCLLAVSLRSGAQGGAQNGLVQGVDTDGFVGAALGSISADLVYVTPHGVTYSYRASPDAAVATLLIAVWTSIDEARSAFRTYVSGLSAPLTPQTIKAGDESWYASLPGVSSSLIFRRDNVMVQFSWQGDEDRGKRLARRMDELLMTDASICPRGQTVPLPAVAVGAPEAATDGTSVAVSYHVEGGAEVRTQEVAGLHSEGVAHCKPLSTEPETLEILFASARNAMFTVRVAVPARQTDKEHGQPWSWLGQRLYFSRQDVPAGAASARATDEWIEIDRGTFGTAAHEIELKQAVLAELGRVLAAEWLPASSLLSVHLDHGAAGARSTYYATFRKSGLGVVEMGCLGECLLIYVERPLAGDEMADAPAAEGMALPGLDDLLQESMEEIGSVQSRTLRRYRAFTDAGPFEPVEILLVSIRFAETLNLRSPGY